MFKRKTVFVVGAGASAEFGFPIGSGLQRKIAQKVRPGVDGRVGNGDDVFLRAFEILKDEARDTTGWFGPGSEFDRDHETAEFIERNIPFAASIDNFLNVHPEPTIVNMGKLAIAGVILEEERNSPLYSSWGAKADIDFREVDNTWLRMFVQIAFEDAPIREMRDVFANVGIISFNYDRTIEQYIPLAIESFTELNLENALYASMNLKIIHPYGQVGFPSWVSRIQGDNLDYGYTPSPETLASLSKGIRTFSEGVADKETSTGMKEMLHEAEQIIFLGFGFNRTNMDLLTISGARSFAHPVIGTVYQMTAPQVEVAEHLVTKALRPPGVAVSPYLADMKCAQLMQDYREWINGSGYQPPLSR